jgi:hypothetical protein
VSSETATCPWCSTQVPVAAATCPNCGASLRDAADGEIAGVTQVDPGAVLRTKRIKPRGIAAWLVGEREAEQPVIGKVEPPSDEVRREMLRLELAAIDAELEAKKQVAEANRELGIEDLAEPDLPARRGGGAAAPAEEPSETAPEPDAAHPTDPSA